MNEYLIREAHQSDLPDIYNICHKTGFNGEDCGDRLSDKYIIGQFYAAPYLFFELDMCFVLTENDIPKGYVIGCSNNKEFDKWMNKYWLNNLKLKYPICDNDNLSNFEKNLRKRINQEFCTPSFLDNYKSHLHIDLLPSVQKKGFGKKLMEIFWNKLRQKNVEKMYLGVGDENFNGIEFYKRIGLYEIKKDPGVIYMGYNL